MLKETFVRITAVPLNDWNYLNHAGKEAVEEASHFQYPQSDADLQLLLDRKVPSIRD